MRRLDYKESKIQIVLNWIYLTVCIHGLWVIGFLLGLGVFSLLPTTVTAFDLVREATDQYRGARLQGITYWWKQFKKNFKKYFVVSFVYHIILFVLAMNYSFLSRQSSMLTYFLFYLTIFLILLAMIVVFWFGFIASKYPHLSTKEIIQNAIAFTISRLVEMIIHFTLLIGLHLIIWNISPGLNVFTAMGIIVIATYFVFMKIHDGIGLHRLFNSLKTNNKTI